MPKHTLTLKTSIAG